MAALQAEVARLKEGAEPTATTEPWWKRIVGVFEGDPDFEEAMRLGREYRASLWPKEDEEPHA